MPDTIPSVKLSHDGAMKLVAAARDKALAMGVPECIVVVDGGGNLLALLRMDGANVNSIDSAWRKAVTAAGNGKPSGGIEPGLGIALGLASDGWRVNLPGGFPVIIGGQVAGAIGIGSGTGEEDAIVAKAALEALPGAQRF
ncbi:MAG TPA: heme-binding protein [Alphaproteobacteria bacterium]